VLALVVAVVVIAVLANYGPLQAYREARARYDSAVAEVESLAQKKAELQSQLGKLTEADYLEALAREELTYAFPGEDVYIITGADEEGTPATGVDAAAGADEDGASGTGTSEGTGVAKGMSAVDGTSAEDGTGAADGASDGDGLDAGSSESTDGPGFLERALSAFLGLF
jgi:cell division protein FtsB